MIVQVNKNIPIYVSFTAFIQARAISL